MLVLGGSKEERYLNVYRRENGNFLFDIGQPCGVGESIELGWEEIAELVGWLNTSARWAVATEKE